MNSEESKNDSAPGDAASAPPRDNTAQPLSLLPTPQRTDEVSREVTPVGDLDLRKATLRLMRGENLSRIEAGHFLSALLNPAATDGQVAAALAVLAVKGETIDELTGMAEAMRNRASIALSVFAVHRHCGNRLEFRENLQRLNGGGICH